MNRQQRRAASKRDRGVAGGQLAQPDDVCVRAQQLLDLGCVAEAQRLCRDALARAPADSEILNLLGLIAQRSDRHAAAVKFFRKAVDADPGNAACHFNLGLSHQALQARDQAATHFSQAIALGLSGRSVGDMVMQSQPVVACIDRMAAAWPRRLNGAELFGEFGITAFSDDVFVCCALSVTRLNRLPLEDVFTQIRAALLQTAISQAPAFAEPMPGLITFCVALARQCFINEYVYGASQDESRQAADLRDRLQQALQSGTCLPPLLVAVVAAYAPLQGLQNAAALLAQPADAALSALLRQQIEEPLEEAEDQARIPALTAFADNVDVRRQYEENPYPRWTLLPHETPAADADVPRSILVAGCGTGFHAIAIAQLYPNARVLAVDISLASLAHARRKTREAGLTNLEYAQADIMKLGITDRRFDRIEAIGVLHHLDEPLAGWRTLLGLLRQGGVMAIGLYSAIARGGINAARAFVMQQGYQLTEGGIRDSRQALIHQARSALRDPAIGAPAMLDDVTSLADFHAMSECRDLLFNAMEHQFTIADIRSFLAAERLSFLGFELDSHVLTQFRAQYPGAETDLACWERFEAAYPQTFLEMYVFSVRGAED